MDNNGQIVPGQVKPVRWPDQAPSATFNNNLDDSMSSVSEHNKVVVVPPAGMMEDDIRKSISTPKNPNTHPASHGEGHREHPGVNNSPIFGGSNGGNIDPSGQIVVDSTRENNFSGGKDKSNRLVSIGQFGNRKPGVNNNPSFGGPTRGNTDPSSKIVADASKGTNLEGGKETSNTLANNGQFVNRKPGRKPAKPVGPPPITRRPPPRRRPTSTPRSVRRKTPRPVFNNAKRPNQVSIDIPAFSPAEKAVNEPLYNGDVRSRIRATPTIRNPNKERKTHGGIELQASIIQGDNQIIGSGPGIAVGRPTDGYMQDVTITGPDGRPVVIQTRQEVVPQIDPSFTVSAGYPAYTDVYTIDPTAQPSFISVGGSSKSRPNSLEYQGWLTDGDPLAGLPPLRPTLTTSLDFTIQETEAPKTVTYHNEWNTPGKSPSADFRPHRPPPPPSNFANEFTALNFAGEVESIPVSVIRPTTSFSYSSIQRTEAPKTVTYANEWFANGNNAPSAVPGDQDERISHEISHAGVDHPASHTGRQPNQTPSSIRQPSRNQNIGPSDVSADQDRRIDHQASHGGNDHPVSHNGRLPVQTQNNIRQPTRDQNKQQPSFGGAPTGNPGHPVDQANLAGTPGGHERNTVRPLVRQPTSNGDRIRHPGQGSTITGAQGISADHPSSHGVRQPVSNANRNKQPIQNDVGIGTQSQQSGQNINSISQSTTKASGTRRPTKPTRPRPTRRRPRPNRPRPLQPVTPLRPVISDKIDVVEVDDVSTGEILGANQWNTFSPNDPSSVSNIQKVPSNYENPEKKKTYQLEDGTIVRIPVSRPGRPAFQRPPYRRPTEAVSSNGNSTIVRNPVSRPIQRPPYRRPTEPTYTQNGAGVPGLDPSNPSPTRETFFDGSFVGQPTPEIINGDVRDPPLPPTTQEAETYDPFQEYQDTFPQFANKPEDPVTPNIKISSDGYNGFSEVGNNGFEVQTEGNNGQYEDNGESDGNVGGGGYPGVGTSSSGASGNLGRPEGQSGPTRRPYKSSEYVNEVRYPPRNLYEETGEDGGDGARSEGGGNFLKIPVVKPNKNQNIFAPTRETPLVSGTEGGESGRKSEQNGEIDLTHLYDTLTGGGIEKNIKRRKFETSSTRNTYSTNGKPTFINIDNTATVSSVRDDDINTGKGSVIITTPSEGSQTSVSQINPVTSTGYSPATTSAVSLTDDQRGGNKDSLNIFKFPQRPKPQPSLGLKIDDNISDNEVIHNNLGAAIVEQVFMIITIHFILIILFHKVPGNILSAEDQDPQTRCQKSCAENEMCQIQQSGEAACKCRPGFGKRTNLLDAQCESKTSCPRPCLLLYLPPESKMYQIEVLTTSESQETRIVRFNPQAVQRAVEKSLKNNNQVDKQYFTCL